MQNANLYRYLQMYFSVTFAIFVHYMCKRDHYYYAIVLLFYCSKGVKNGRIINVVKSYDILSLLEIGIGSKKF